MKMPFDLADSLQSDLAEWLPIDNPNPMHFVYDNIDKRRNARTNWQIAVDLLYRLLIANLLELWPDSMLGGFNAPEFPVKALRFCEVLAQIDPAGGEAYEIHSLEYHLPWVGFDLCLTNTTRCLLAKHGLVWSKDKDMPFNEAFIEDIEAMFELHGVAWSDTPLIPIRAELINR